MNAPNRISPADTIDRLIQLYAGIAILMAAKFAVSAAMVVVQGPILGLLDKAELTLTTLAVVLALSLLLFHWRKLPTEQREAYLKGEGFVPEALRRAAIKAFFLSFLLMSFMPPISTRFPVEYDAQFFLNVSLSFMLVTLATTFFLHIRKT